MSADEEVQVPGVPVQPSMEYKVDQGRQGRFIIRSCFGGADCTFVAAGSEVSLWLKHYVPLPQICSSICQAHHHCLPLAFPGVLNVKTKEACTLLDTPKTWHASCP